jgi:hypothetical protein
VKLAKISHDVEQHALAGRQLPFVLSRSSKKYSSGVLNSYAISYSRPAETDLPPEAWTPSYADIASACSGVMYPMAEWIR